ncbi:MAG: AAA family ATPase [Promethearchaeota archaeon]
MTLDLETPWVEKYRPKTFNEIVSQNIAINNIAAFVKSGNMPHMIFSGPAGTGKTSTALIIARELIKRDDYYSSVLELNASDTVRMDYVRNVIKDFVNQNINIKATPLKLVLLDEADNIPRQVQQALRRIIEKASSNVKFILMCNYINNIIDPIISRCAVFRFVNLSKERVIKRLKFIVNKEKILIPKEKETQFFDTLFFTSGGDLRKAINTLQMAVALELLDDLDINELLKISGFVDNHTLNNIVEALKEKNFIKIRNIVRLIESFDSRNFIRQLLHILPEIGIISPKNMSILKAYFGEIDYRISQGADDQIQLLALLAEMIKNIE